MSRPSEERDAERQCPRCEQKFRATDYRCPMCGNEDHMLPPERDAEMLGVPVWRFDLGMEHGGWAYAPGFMGDQPGSIASDGPQPGRWHAEPVAVARQRVVEAALVFAMLARPGTWSSAIVKTHGELLEACRNLQALDATEGTE